MRYITARQAQNVVHAGGTLQGGNWVKTNLYPELSRQVNSSYRMHPTNNKVSVQKRYMKVMSAGKSGRVLESEPMSAHVAKKYMTYKQTVSECERLAHIVVKANACSAILKESL